MAARGKRGSTDGHGSTLSAPRALVVHLRGGGPWTPLSPRSCQPSLLGPGHAVFLARGLGGVGRRSPRWSAPGQERATVMAAMNSLTRERWSREPARDAEVASAGCSAPRIRDPPWTRGCDRLFDAEATRSHTGNADSSPDAARRAQMGAGKENDDETAGQTARIGNRNAPRDAVDAAEPGDRR